MLKLQEFILNHPKDWEILLKHNPYNLTIKYDGMTCIISALMTHYDISTTCIEVSNFSFTLVAPLCANNNQCVTHNFIHFRPPQMVA